MSEAEDPADLTETINCPNCGGVATYRHGAFSALCPYCGRSISTPGEQPARPVEQPKRPAEQRTRPPLRSTEPSDFWNRYPPGPARASAVRRRSWGLALGLVLLVGAVLVSIWLADRPPGIPTPTLQPTKMPWPTAVPATAAPTATPLSPPLSVTLEFGQGAVAPRSFAPPDRILLITRYTGARRFDNPFRTNFRRKSALHLMQQTQTANCC
jgi:hypothetical protein